MSDIEAENKNLKEEQSEVSAPTEIGAPACIAPKTRIEVSAPWCICRPTTSRPPMREMIAVITSELAP